MGRPPRCPRRTPPRRRPRPRPSRARRLPCRPRPPPAACLPCLSPLLSRAWRRSLIRPPCRRRTRPRLKRVRRLPRYRRPPATPVRPGPLGRPPRCGRRMPLRLPRPLIRSPRCPCRTRPRRRQSPCPGRAQRLPRRSRPRPQLRRARCRLVGSPPCRRRTPVHHRRPSTSRSRTEQCPLSRRPPRSCPRHGRPLPRPRRRLRLLASIPLLCPPARLPPPLLLSRTRRRQVGRLPRCRRRTRPRHRPRASPSRARPCLGGRLLRGHRRLRRGRMLMRPRLRLRRLLGELQRCRLGLRLLLRPMARGRPEVRLLGRLVPCRACRRVGRWAA
ncbi:hypothetical protein amrb99_75600 [Actinomadura sp. RB99]|nr:hypothetical protein [Actinomadura sp. RB99]